MFGKKLIVSLLTVILLIVSSAPVFAIQPSVSNFNSKLDIKDAVSSKLLLNEVTNGNTKAIEIFKSFDIFNEAKVAQKIKDLGKFKLEPGTSKIINFDDGSSIEFKAFSEPTTVSPSLNTVSTSLANPRTVGMTRIYRISGTEIWNHSVVAFTQFVDRNTVNVLSSYNVATCYFGTYQDKGTTVANNGKVVVYVTGGVIFTFSFDGQPVVTTNDTFTIFIDSTGIVGFA